jgi:Protein of unknown function (DUF3276)
VVYDNNDKKNESVYSKRIRAGKRRTYFFDVRATRGNDYYLTITESRKRFNDDGYDRHKVFLYKEDFNKFIKGLAEAIDYVKTDLMPDFDFDAFNHDTPYEGDGSENGGGYEGEAPRNEAEAIQNDAPVADAEVIDAPVSTVSSAVKEEETPASASGTTDGTVHEEVDKW